MRFRMMGSVLGGLAGVVIVATISCLLWERAILWVGGSQFRNELSELKRLTFRQDYLEACKESGTKLIRPVEGVQLRFMSETEYMIEPICVDKSIKALPIKQGKLLVGVKRLYGPGIFIPIINGNPEIMDGWVVLVAGKTSVVVGFFNGQSELKWELPDEVIGGESPAIASCSDWGFSCCQAGNTDGMGVQAFPSDCVASCYQTCNQRPVILFFNSDPRMNNDRIVFIQGRRAIVDFGFEVADFDGVVAKTQLDFGDGEIVSTLTAKEALIGHEYECLMTQCVFEAVLSANDANGSDMAEGQTNRILIVMQP